MLSVCILHTALVAEPAYCSSPAGWGLGWVGAVAWGSATPLRLIRAHAGLLTCDLTDLRNK